jgi:branched-chain amino acid transport system substrate-binding protein
VKKRVMWLAVPAAIIVLVAGCSSSSSSTTGSNSTGTSQSSSTNTGTQAAGGSAIPVGVVGTFSGPLAELTASGEGAMEAWADSVNAAGGIDRHPVKLYVEDDAGDAAQSLTAVKTLVEQDHVVAIVGQNSANLGWQSYVESEGIPVVGGGEAVDLPYLTSSDFFDVGGNLLSIFDGIAALGAKRGPKMALLYCVEAPGCKAVTSLVGALGKPQGLAVAYGAGVSASAPDYTAQCLGIKNAGAESYDLSVASAVTARIAGQCKQLGVTGTLIQPGVEADTNSLASPALDGSQFVDDVLGFFVDSTPATKQFHEALAKYAPSVGTASAPLSTAAMGAWASGKLFEAAVEASGASTVTPASVKQGLYALHGETLGGLVPPLTFTKGKPTLTNCYFTYELQNGKFQESDLEPVCADAATDKLIAAIAASLG